MAINFPSSPAVGQAHNVSPGNSFYYWDGVWVPAPVRTALPKNYFVNPAMQISQENGNTAGTATWYYPADQWYWQRSSAQGISVQRVQAVTPKGSPNRIRMTVTASGTSASDQTYIAQHFEGARMADLMWGTAAGKQVVLRFGFKAPAGTYGVTLISMTASPYYSYHIPLTISAGQANTDTEQVFVIPKPPVSGTTWGTGTGANMMLSFAVFVGSLVLPASNLTWNSTAYQAGCVGQTNGAGVNGNVFELYDVGLYADPYNTGVAPPFELPDYAQELRRCQRYWTPIYASRGFAAGTTVAARMSAMFPAPMRIAPTVTIRGSPMVFDGSGGYPMTSIPGNYSNAFVMEVDGTCAAGAFGAGRPADQYWDAENNCLIASARM